MASRTIRIAAAIIMDGAGRTLLARKRGTDCFMQAGGKIEPGETPLAALTREVREELNVSIATAAYLGRFTAPAAHEAGALVEAELFNVKLSSPPVAGAEIAEIIWASPDNTALNLAPLTQNCVLPLLANWGLPKFNQVSINETSQKG